MTQFIGKTVLYSEGSYAKLMHFCWIYKAKNTSLPNDLYFAFIILKNIVYEKIGFLTKI